MWGSQVELVLSGILKGGGCGNLQETLANFWGQLTFYEKLGVS